MWDMTNIFFLLKLILMDFVCKFKNSEKIVTFTFVPKKIFWNSIRLPDDWLFELWPFNKQFVDKKDIFEQ